MYSGESFTSLGLTPGTYVWTMPNDSFTLNVGPTAFVPEPSSVALLGIGVTGLCGYGWRRRNSTHTAPHHRHSITNTPGTTA